MSVSFKYDPFGRRIYKSSTATTSVYAYDGDNLIEETGSTGTATARYTMGLNIDEPLAILQGTTTDYYQADGAGGAALNLGAGCFWVFREVEFGCRIPCGFFKGAAFDFAFSATHRSLLTSQHVDADHSLFAFRVMPPTAPRPVWCAWR